MKTLLINLSNIKTGGALQVASSFLEELITSKQSLEFFDTTILVSNSVSNLSIRKKLFKSSKFKILENENNFFKQFSIKYVNFINSFDVVFNLFGPHFYCFKHKRQYVISGFAQAWILFPYNETYHEFGFIKKRFYTLKYKILNFYFSKSDSFVVEHENIREELRKTYPNKPIHIATNSINQVFVLNQNSIKKKLKKSNDIFKIGVIGDNYPHKNLKILTDLSKELKSRNINFDFTLTLTDNDFKSYKFSNFKEFHNLGKLSIEECFDFYNSIDIVFFPSNLECFSATILESLYMGKPLICSDYIFNRAIANEYAYYFEPNSIISAANLIENVMVNYESIVSSHKISEARELVLNSFNFSTRFNSYFKILKSIYESTSN